MHKETVEINNRGPCNSRYAMKNQASLTYPDCNPSRCDENVPSSPGLFRYATSDQVLSLESQHHQYHQDGALDSPERRRSYQFGPPISPGGRRSSLTIPVFSDNLTSPSVLDPPSSDTSASIRRAAKELLGINSMRGRRSIVDVRSSSNLMPNQFTEDGSFLLDDTDDRLSYGSMEMGSTKEETAFTKPRDYGGGHPNSQNRSAWLIQQTAAVAVIGLLNIMIAIPFGVSYFPVGWRGDAAGNVDDSEPLSEDAGVSAKFPLPGKVALGIRMFLFATFIGQFALTFSSKFTNPIALQMVENVPFLHALAWTVNKEQGYGIEALSTLFFLFGLSSVLVGMTFYALGRMELGRIVYFFPSHVLVGCIGGIGVFILITSIEVTNDSTFTFDLEGLQGLVDNFHLFRVVLGFEGTLRLLIWATQDDKGRPRFKLLSPIFYCMITPMFYAGLWLLGISIKDASDAGFFFPATESTDTSSPLNFFSDEHMFDMFKVIDLRTVSWSAVFHSTGTMIALAAFSLIHVPINIPAFAVSTDVGK